MKRLFLAGVIVLSALFSLPHLVSAQDFETIESLKVKAAVTEDRRLTMTETIIYNFGTLERHGIFRMIPEVYERKGVTYALHLRNVKVLMDGAPVSFSRSESNGALQVKIGDPDRVISGIHTYAITYETNRAVNFFSDHSEIYWNVTGNQWPAPIGFASFELEFPPGATEAPRLACYTGAFGSTESNCEMSTHDRTVFFSTTQLLNREEGFTIVVGFSLGVIHAPTTLERAGIVLRDNKIFGLPVVAFVLMFAAWWTRGRDPKLGTVIPLYEPPEGLHPADMAAVVENGALSKHAITATILDLARRGFLHIRYGEEGTLFKKQTFTFLKKNENTGNLQALEKVLFKGIFYAADLTEISLKELVKHGYYKAIRNAEDVAWETCSEKGYFTMRPAAFRGILITAVGTATFFGVGILLPSFADALAVVLTGIIVAAFGWFIPSRTKKGADLLAEIKGFEWFLSVTERDRLAFHNAPERTPEQFQELLPYAIALGVEKEWAKQFEGIDLAPPDWAEGQSSSWKSSLGYLSAISSFHSQVASSGYSAPSSSSSSSFGSGGSGFSGGSSGGGGGGGGGGSW